MDDPQPAPDPFRRATDRARAAAFAAARHAISLGHRQTTPEHLLLGIISADESIAVMVLAALGIPPSALRERIEAGLAGRQDGATKHPPKSDDYTEVLWRARRRADQFGSEYVSTDHLLVALGEGEGAVRDALVALGATPDRVAAEAWRMLRRYTHGRPWPGHEPSADQLVGARRLVVPREWRAYPTRIAEVRGDKEAAIEAGDFERAALLRETEKRLLVERAELARAWIAEVGPVLVVSELDRLYAETDVPDA
ncbi:hypothetical protein GCM10009682_59120 [Luedemannella flava]|uniref:Clp R domain-containing protein n=1 Tax=Luedemannella flava TaxID=349316 RepID=A0ABP4Z1G0_9ACTN